MKILNDSKGEINGNVKLTLKDVEILVDALMRMQSDQEVRTLGSQLMALFSEMKNKENNV